MNIQTSDILSALAFLFSILSFCKTNSIEKGEIELHIRDVIASARNKHLEITLKLSNDLANEDLQKAEKSAFEDLLNAYQEACAKYLDNKTDKKRFRKTYYDDIEDLVKNEASKEYLHPQNTKFQAINKVYNEWFIRE